MFYSRSGDSCIKNVVKLNDTLSSEVDSCKYLGVLIASDLTWKLHIDYVYLKLLKFSTDSAD